MATFVRISDRQIAHRAGIQGEVPVRVVRERWEDGRYMEVLSIVDWQSGVHVRDVERPFVPTAAERKAAFGDSSDLDAVPYGC